MTDQPAIQELLARLPDTPENCIARHALLSGRGHVYAQRDALVIDPDVTPGELLAFGAAQSISHILSGLTEWSCVEVAPSLADAVTRCLTDELQLSIEQVRDLYFTIERPIRPEPHPNTRLLTPADADWYAKSAASYCEDPEDARRNVLEGPVAVAIVDGRIVASAEANARTARYANINVHTLPEFRGRGYATAASVAAVGAVRAMGLVPLWSCNEKNLGSQHVARKLGFAPVSHCVYLMRQQQPE